MKIKLDKEKFLEFEMDASGVSEEDLKGYLRFVFEEIEYGFPVKIKDNKISVNIPPLQNVINNQVKESISKHSEIVVKGRLDIIANENSYVCPWKGDVEIEIPVAVRLSEKNEKKESKMIKIVSDPDKMEFLNALKEEDKKEEKKEDKKEEDKKKSKFADAMGD